MNLKPSHKLTGSAVAVALLLVLCISVYSTMYTPNELDSEISIDFKRGSTIRSLANELQQHDLLESTGLFIFWARMTGVASRLQAGEYLIEPGVTLANILDDIVSGRVQQYPLVLLEGWTFRQFIEAVHTHEAITHTLKDKTQEQIMEAIGYPGQHPEGRFFPDTYFIHRGTEDVALLKRAYRVMATRLESAWEGRDSDLPFNSPYDALILASIVEKESAVPEERPVIAGVFINRLKKKMRLQTDPTVIYGMGDSYDGDIRFRDLKTDTPYNTYTRRGLPPTPIAMPGIGAIEAVMRPEKTPYLYFVAINDNSGRHEFSETLEQHENAVDRYQRKRRKKQ